MESNDAPSGSQKQTSQDRLNNSLSIIAQSVEVLAAKANETATEKDWDKAERERKKAHDNRTFKRQGWTAAIATVALAFNCVALGIAVYQGSRAKHSAAAAEASAQTAQEALQISQRGRITFYASDTLPLDLNKVPFGNFVNTGHSAIQSIRSSVFFLPESSKNITPESLENQFWKPLNVEVNPSEREEVGIVFPDKKYGEILPADRSDIKVYISIEYSDELNHKYKKRECSIYHFLNGAYVKYVLCGEWNKTITE